VKNKVILAGAGIGSADNITLAVKKALDEADVIIYDRLLNKNIIMPYLNSKETYYVGKSIDKHTLSQEDINKLLVDKAKEGKKVVRLKGGDPYIFARGGEEALYLSENGLDFEVLPGLTSGTVCLNTAGIVPTFRDISTSISFITGHREKSKPSNFSQYAKLDGTLVFYMGLKNLENIVYDLIRGGIDQKKPLAIISNGASGDQEVYTSTIGQVLNEVNLYKVRTPSIIVIGDTVSLRRNLNYFEQKTLFGKTIALTRDLANSLILANHIEALGGKALILPTIKINPINQEKLEKDIKNFDYDYLVFTSVNAVRIFFDKFIGLRDIRDLAGVKIAAIGEKTKEEIEKYYLKVNIVPEKYQGEFLVKKLGSYLNKESKVYFPHSNLSRKEVADSIKSISNLTELAIYENIIPEEAFEIDEKIDAIMFSSSSTVDNFICMYGKNILEDTQIYSIGDITTQVIESYGLKVYKQADKSTIASLIELIKENIK
jgi:uroporphyrinogen-III C-methyltransferase